jgi:hypothetical protein
VERARSDFARSNCAILSELLEHKLSRRFANELDRGQYAPNAHRSEDAREFARDLTLAFDGEQQEHV